MKGKGLLVGILVFIALGFYIREFKVIYSGVLVADGDVIQTVVLNGGSSATQTQSVAFSGVINDVMQLDVSCFKDLNFEDEQQFNAPEGETTLEMLSWNKLKVIYRIQMNLNALDAIEKIKNKIKPMNKCKVTTNEQ